MKIFLDGQADSTERREGVALVRRLFVVYEAPSGRVVHVHSCRGDARFVEDDSHPKMALQRALRAHSGKDLRVLAVPAELLAEGYVSLSVDHAAGKVMVTRAEDPSSETLQSLAAGRPATY